jgi:hypothetical protein
MLVLVQNPSTNASSNNPKSIVINSGNEAFTGYNFITYPILYENSTVESQLRTFFNNLKIKMYIKNEDEIITYLLALSKDIDKLIEPFLYINKIVRETFPDKIKILIKKYDDPETKDHFILIDIRQRDYPDDFIDKIWEIRESFSEKFSDNSWIQITTDYKSLSD